MSFFYNFYGLGLESSSVISGLDTVPAGTCKIDLRLEEGLQPEWVRALLSLPGKILNQKLEPPGTAEPSFILTQHGEEEGFDLAYSDGARFVVDGLANRIWGSYRPPLTAEDMTVYFLGPIMGFVLRRRKTTCLHSSGVELHGHAICFCGDAGYGKSTTAAALALRGYPVIAEDIVALEQLSDRFLAVPGYPRVCLWPESVQMLLGSADNLPLITPTWEKRYLPLDGRRARFAGGKLPLGLVYVFADRLDDASAPRIETIGSPEAVLQLVQNTYMNWVLGREQRAEEFDVLCRLVEQVAVRRIVPHAQPEKLSELCDLIVQDAGEYLAARAHSSASVHP